MERSSNITKSRDVFDQEFQTFIDELEDSNNIVSDLGGGEDDSCKAIHDFDIADHQCDNSIELTELVNKLHKLISDWFQLEKNQEE